MICAVCRLHPRVFITYVYSSIIVFTSCTLFSKFKAHATIIIKRSIEIITAATVKQKQKVITYYCIDRSSCAYKANSIWINTMGKVLFHQLVTNYATSLPVSS